ncbi:MAG: hypothetical protein ACP5I1_20680, partial [Candidatus Hinthialibacter sp.]
LIPFNDDDDDEANPAVITFNEDALEDGLPKTVSLFLTSEDEVNLAAYNDNGELLSAEVEFEYKDDDFYGEEYQIQNGNPGNGDHYRITIRVRNNASNVQPVVLSHEDGIERIELLGESDVCLQKICWDCKHINPMPTPIPGETGEPSGEVWVTTAPNSSEGDISGQTINSAEHKELVINWDFQNYPAKDFHIYAQVDGSNKRMYVGRTGDGNATSYVWNSNSRFITGLFKRGPQPGHSYLFMVFAISSEKGVKPFGPIIAGGWIDYTYQYQPPTPTPEPEPTPMSTEEPGVTVSDSLTTYDDLSGGEDIDMPGNRGLVIRWSSQVADGAKEIEVFVEINGNGQIMKLGESKNPQSLFLNWAAGEEQIMEAFQNGPDAGYSYTFYLYAKSQNNKLNGPFKNKGPVELVLSPLAPA